MTQLVTMAQAKRHLYIDEDDTSRDEDILDKIEEASAAVISYLQSHADDFTSTGGIINLDSNYEVVPDSPGVHVPFQIRAATLQLLTALFENRGDDGGAQSKFEPGYLPPSVTALLYPLRIPVIA